MGHRQSTVKRALLFGILSLLSLSLFARGEPSEDQVKAAFVYNFAKFVEWPDTAFDNKDAPLLLCIVGKDKVGAALQLLEQREVQGRELHVSLLPNGSKDSFKGVRCHILFIAGSEVARQQEIVQQFLDAPVLTVADNLDFVKQGGMISLYVEEQRVQFAINQNATHNNGLKLSARMLQLARAPR